jgi:hypothetical protein
MSNTKTMTMKRVLSFVLVGLLSSASATPALVWKSSESTAATVHSSKSVSPHAIFDFILPATAESETVVFLLGRGEKGSETLTSLAAEGSLPGVSAKYDDADCIHHHVAGVRDSNAVAKEAGRARPSYNVVELSLSEYQNRPAIKEQLQEMEISATGMINKSLTKSKKRAKMIIKGDLFIVNVDATTDPKEIDAAVVSAIEDTSIDHVVLSAQRSLQEIKHEREHEMRRIMTIQEKAGRGHQSSRNNKKRRRLEENEDQEAEDNQEEDEEVDMTGVYYVSMTPNILAGILFMFLFTFIIIVGLGCMNQIQGGDVFATKLPNIGREA